MRYLLGWRASPERRDRSSRRRRRAGGVDDVRHSLARRANRARWPTHEARARIMRDCARRGALIEAESQSTPPRVVRNGGGNFPPQQTS
jgi:hypothetical protein